MKRIALLCAVIFVAQLTYAQKLKESEVPAAVRSTFARNFPKATGTKWSKESDTEFEAEFKNGSLEQAANFNQNGDWLITETEIKMSELPAAVTSTISKEFPGYKIQETEKAETPGEGSFYEVELKKDKIKSTVQISADGKVLKKE
jgi:hypothetical protein